MNWGESIGLAARLAGWDYPTMMLYGHSSSMDLPELFDPDSRTGWKALVGGTALIALTVWSCMAWIRGNRLIAAGFLTYMLLLLPYLHFVTPIGDTRAPRFFYAAVAVLCIGFTQIIMTLGLKVKKRKSKALTVGIVALALAPIVLQPFSFDRWASDASLWKDEREHHPTSPKALIYAAMLEAGSTSDSQRKAMDEALRHWPYHPEALMRRATFALQIDNDPQTAGDLLNRLRSVHPHMSGLLTLEAAIAMRTGQRSVGLKKLQEARRANEFDPVCRLQLAKDAETNGRVDEAEVLLREAIEILLAPTPGYSQQIAGVLSKLELLIGRGALSQIEFQKLIDYCLDELPSGRAEDLIRARFTRD
jgi:hypothetical protein